MSSIPKENIECLECGEVYPTRVALSAHIQIHKMSSLEYVDKYYDLPKCACCDQPAKRRHAWEFRSTCGNASCLKDARAFSHTPETRARIRESRLKYLAQKGGETAWEKRAAGGMSYLEQWFYDRIIKEHHLSDNNQIIAEHRVSWYSIDYAFVNLNLAVELDGKCHFTNGKERVQTDLKKSKVLQDRGWFVYRIAWDEVQKHPDETVKKFMNFLDERLEGDSGSNVDEGYFWDRHEASKRLNRRNELARNAKAAAKSAAKKKQAQDRFDALIEAGIDFSEFGWVQKASEVWGITPQAVGRYFRDSYPAFYDENCFKRSPLSVSG